MRKVLVFGDRRFWRQLACSRLRDGGGKSFSNKKCEKRTGAGETPPPPPFPSRARLIFAFLSSHYVYYLRAWHRLGGNTINYPSENMRKRDFVSKFATLLNL